MNKAQLVTLLQKLNLPKNEFVIFGGGCLAIRSIRVTIDLDLYVTKKLYKTLRNNHGGEVERHGQTYLVFYQDNTQIDAHAEWNILKDWQPNFPDYLSRPEGVEGLPFMPLQELYEWKKAVRRPKDVEDLDLIEAYWQTSSRP